MLKGIDISNYQGSPAFSAVLKSVDFVLIKATEGVGYKDPQFDNSISELRSLNALHGVYHFARPDLNNKPEDEAAWFIQTVNPEVDEVLALDFEVGYGDPVNWCKAFLDAVSQKLNGYKPLIYLNLNLIQTHDWSSVINSGYGLWLADYDGITDNTPDTPWPVVATKQYSSTGQVSGISGNVDMDSFFGDATAWRAYGYHPAPVSSNTGNPAIGPDVNLTDQYDVNAWNDLLSYRSQRTDGPGGNMQGYIDALIGHDRDYSKLTGQVSVFQSQNQTLTQTVNDLTAKLQQADDQIKSLSQSPKNTSIPADNPPTPVVIPTSFFGQLFGRLSQMFG